MRIDKAKQRALGASYLSPFSYRPPGVDPTIYIHDIRRTSGRSLSLDDDDARDRLSICLGS